MRKLKRQSYFVEDESGVYCVIPLTQGRVTKVDTEDYELAVSRNWSVDSYGYVCGSHGIPRKRISLSREILHPPIHMDVDHINHDTLDNRRSNLRVLTTSQNMMNMMKCARSTSKYKGVSKRRELRAKPWRAYISINGKRKYLGHYSNQNQAGHAYDQAATKYYGEFALLNFPRSV